MRQDVCQSTDDHAEIAIERADAADGAGAVVIKCPLLAHVLQAGQRKKRLQGLYHSDRAATGTAASMRSRERLVQVEVHDIHAESPGLGDTDQRVHVRAIHVEQRAFLVENLRDALDVRLEDTQRIGIRDHERGDILVYDAFELLPDPRMPQSLERMFSML